ncbi:MAG TPA: hypothetical protein VNZ03_00965 [Terriglobales bacterium]|jgi:hypothetical protein|nr:hypothetical protein [Terriglobales bacterium]
MRIKVLAFAVSLLLISNCWAGIPQSPTTTASSPQAATLLAQSANALAGSIAVNDVTLTGTAEWIAGSDDETGTAIFKGIHGSHRLDLTFRNGTRSEIVSNVNGDRSGAWSGPDGKINPIANHNLVSEAGIFPAFTLHELISLPNALLTYVGQETRDHATVIHLSASQQFPKLNGDPATLMQHLAQVEIFLDPTTFLPVSYLYNSHPDNDARLDIPTEIRYSNYQNITGVQIPLHIQKFMNGSLVLDLQFQNTSLNSGVSIPQIIAQ